jgi:hypothetical protein
LTTAVAFEIIACVPAVADLIVIGPEQVALALNKVFTVTVRPASKVYVPFSAKFKVPMLISPVMLAPAAKVTWLKLVFAKLDELL